MTTTKPQKPYHDFPLTAHPNGQWSKKIRGKPVYFGVWADPDAALQKYLAERDYLYSGQRPPTEGTTLADALNAYLTDRAAARDEGDIASRTYDEYEEVCDKIATLNTARPLDSLTHAVLLDLRARLGKGKNGQQISPNSHKRYLTIARSVFTFANDHLDANIRFKDALRSPKARTIRQHRNEVGERMFEADEIKALFDTAANPQIKAMILLGINCGFGNQDCGTLPIEALDLENGFHNYWRPKTQIQRRCPLWSETVEALQPIVADRESGLVFTTAKGNCWWQEGPGDAISYEFRKLTKAVGIYRKGVTTFYSLRRTFETVAGAWGVQAAIDHIMGHGADASDMGAVYRQRIYDDQLKQCTEFVREWHNGNINIG